MYHRLHLYSVQQTLSEVLSNARDRKLIPFAEILAQLPEEPLQRLNKTSLQMLRENTRIKTRTEKMAKQMRSGDADEGAIQVPPNS